MKAQILYILILTNILFNCKAQSENQIVTFKILYGKDSIGILTAQKMYLSNNRISYNIVSNVEVKMLFQLNISTEIKAIYDQNKLVEGRHISITNKNVFDTNTQTIWQNNQYIINKNGKKNTYNKPITFSVNKLYFVEPINQTSIYAEDQARYLPILKINANTYELKTDSNKSNLYKYLGGKLVEVEVQILIGKIKFVRI